MDNVQNKSRKKLWIALGSLAVAVIVGLSITVGVLAASTAQVTSAINVTYTASQVAATVSGEYQVLNGSATAFQTSGNQNTIVFNGSEGTASGAFVAVNDITLTATNNSVTFRYTIQNDSSSKGISAQVTLPTTQTNVTVSAGTAVTVPQSGEGESVTVTAGTNHVTDSFVVPANTTVTYTITVSITNVANDASFAGSFVWSLEPYAGV